MNQDIRWIQRFSNYKKALVGLVIARLIRLYRQFGS